VYILHKIPLKENKPVKIVLLGEGGVGKTTISKSYTDNFFFTKSKQTIAVEFHSKIIDLPNLGNYKLQIWDLGGQEHFKQMGVFRDFCKGADAALLCFDLTDLSTLISLTDWLEFIEPNIPRFLIGTKLDLASSDECKIDLNGFIRKLKCNHAFKCSSKDIKSILTIFEMILILIGQNKQSTRTLSSNSKNHVSNTLLTS
jgi:small GTP-binding protein